jgi:cytochrome c oxidase subunit 4
MSKTPLQHSHHIVPTMTYFVTFLVLGGLMLLTIIASYWNLPGGVISNNMLAMGIAVIKAFLVMWIFMGVKWAPRLAKLWAVAGVIVMPLMFIMFQDYFLRYQENVPSWNGRQESALPRVMDAKNPNNQVPPNDAGFRPRG